MHMHVRRTASVKGGKPIVSRIVKSRERKYPKRRLVIELLEKAKEELQIR